MKSATLKIAGGASLLTLLAATAFPTATSATYLGGKFAHTPGTTTTLNYTYNSPHRYSGNAWQGAANWRNAATRVKPTSASSNIKITVTDIYTNDNYYGQAWINPCEGCATYTSAGFRLNQRTMDPLGDFDRTFVATHEFGHTLGLAHTTGTTADTIMKQGGSGFVFPWYNTPMPYDKNQINALYN